MNQETKVLGDLHLSFDVGHSSIGWAVLRSRRREEAESKGQPKVEILGTGVVTFGADDCLAFKRRQYRQQRRHARSTRQRIGRMEQLLAHLGVLSAVDLKARHDQGKGDSFAWHKAAEVLAAARAGKPLPEIGWPELWDALRWYAHNRGYFSPPWANRSDEVLDDDAVPDTEKVKNAGELAHDLGTETMAETIAAYTVRYEAAMIAWHQARAAATTAKKPFKEPKPMVHFKGRNCAFPRETVVWPEVHSLLTALKGKLPKLDDALIRTLLGNDVDPLKDREAWKTISCPALKLPKRYHGGLLFGQMISRFENRIIGVCPIQFATLEARYLSEGLDADEAKHRAAKEAKLPAKATPEFLRFRWAMQLANVFGANPGDPKTRPLNAEERRKLTEQAERQGAFSKGEFKKVVRAMTGWKRDNFENIFPQHDEDAKEALELNPVQNEIRKCPLATALDALPDRYRKRLRGKLSAGKTVTLGEVRDWIVASSRRRESAHSDSGDQRGLMATATEAEALAAFDAAVDREIERANTKRGKKQAATTRDGLLNEKLTVNFPSGRAPYARPILRQAYDEAMSGIDPRAEKSADQPRGVLCQTDELKEAQLHRRLDEQTNNHLIRHRLLILERLLEDLIAAPEFADGDKSRVAGLTIEVNRELRDLSGKTRKEQEQDLGRRLADFKDVAKKVEDACKRRGVSVTAGIIRKARVSEDLGWKCPYTGKAFEIDALLGDTMDKDHIIPHAERQSDSLDSLVMTWKEVNKWKGKRTAMQFIREEGGKTVPGRPELSIMPLETFKKHVASLDTRKGHNDDKARKKRRIRRLLTENYEEKEFTPRDLTVTSHLVRLGAQVLKRHFSDLPREHRNQLEPVSLPGSVTGEIRKAWKLMGCLELANPSVMEEVEERDEATGEMRKVRRAKKKQDIRGITHLHHALDACVLGLIAFYFPKNGALWSAMLKATPDQEAGDERSLWAAMTKRRPSEAEAKLLLATGFYEGPDEDGRVRLKDKFPEALNQQIRRRLAEKRVVEHVPSDMSGLGKRVTQNTSGILEVRDKQGAVLWKRGQPFSALDALRSRGDLLVKITAVKESEDGEGGEISSKPVIKPSSTLFGFNPESGDGKLAWQNGVRLIRDNFGIALVGPRSGPVEATMIPWMRVWHRLDALRKEYGGEIPRILRKGKLIRVSEGELNGTWRVLEMSCDKDGRIVCELGQPDSITLRMVEKDATGKSVRRTSAGCKRGVSIERLIKANFQILKTSYVGVPVV